MHMETLPHGAARRIDGRTTRWDAHRARRRSELTQAALRALRRHGPSVGTMEYSENDTSDSMPRTPRSMSRVMPPVWRSR